MKIIKKENIYIFSYNSHSYKVINFIFVSLKVFIASKSFVIIIPSLKPGSFAHTTNSFISLSLVSSSFNSYTT